MRMILVRLLAILFGLLLFCVTMELACRLVFSQTVAYDVEMWRYARDVKMTGLTPGLRFEHRPNTSAHLMGVDVVTNAEGLRDRDYLRPKPAGTFRIAVIGDSVTFGWGVHQDRTYPKRLESLLNQQRPLGSQVAFEVINFGVGNYTADDVAAMLQYKAISYNPDLIIYGAFINDAEIPRVTFAQPWLLRHSLSAVLIWGRLDRLWRQMGLRDDYREYYLGLYRAGGSGRQRVREALQKMMRSSRTRSAPLFVALLPELHDHDGNLFGAVREFYREATIESGARFIDLQGVLTENDWRRYWVSADDAHPNADACDAFARAIMNEFLWADVVRP